MSTDPRPAPGDPRSPEGDEQRLLALLEGYKEELRRGGDATPQRWQDEHPGAPDGLRALRALAALDGARRALGEALPPAGSDAGASPPGAAGVAGHPLLEPGSRLGECRIVRLLGRGGMGEVYLAEDEVSGRQVAVKVLPARLAGDPASDRRFRKSVQILEGLDWHPHIVPALRHGTWQDLLYLVLEYVSGEDLKTRLDRTGPLPVGQACAVVRQAAEGLAYAHQQGIVHRDIKPANLIVTPDGTVKLLDLGLARLVTTEAAGGEESLTHSGEVMGTLDYLAPEQARDARRANARSDLYSLGCTFYCLLAGRPPFAGRAHWEKVGAHIRDKPQAIRKVRPDVPPAVAAVVHRLLAKRPEDRYQSARDLITALDAAEGAPAPVRRRWVGVAVALLLLAAMAIGVQKFRNLAGRSLVDVNPADRPPPNPADPSVVDAFWRAHIDPSGCEVEGKGGGTAAVEGGALVLNPGDGPQGRGVQNKSEVVVRGRCPLSLIGSSVVVQTPEVPTNDASTTLWLVCNDPYAKLEIFVEQNNRPQSYIPYIHFNYYRPGCEEPNLVLPLMSLAYSPRETAWWRVKEASGTVFFETSADGHDWKKRGSVPVADLGFPLTSLSLELWANGWGAGPYGRARYETLKAPAGLAPKR